MNRTPAPGSGPGATSRPRLLDWRALLGIGISALLLYFAFRGEDLGEVAGEIARAQPVYLILATAAATIVFWIRAWRWRSLLAHTREDTTFRSRFAAVAIGFMGNNLLPARMGEFARAYALSRMESVPIVASFSTLVVERMFDGLALVAFLFLATALPDFPSDRFSGNTAVVAAAVTMTVLVLLTFIVLFLLVLWPRRTVRFLEAIVGRILPRRMRRPVVDALEAFLTGVSTLRDGRLVLRTTAWTLVLWLTNGFSFWLAFRAFGIDASLTAAFFLQSVVAIAVSVPSSPGFFGVFEYAARTVLVELWDENATRALGFAVGFHLAGFIPITLIGLWYAWRLGLSLRTVSATEETVERAVEGETGGGRH